MLTYILLFSLIAIIILGVIRASKQSRPGARPQKEPFVSIAQNEIIDEIEMVGKPRIISHAQTNPAPPIPQEKDNDEDFDSDTSSEDLLNIEKNVEIPELPTSDAPPLFAAKPTPHDASSFSDKNTVPNDVIVIHVLANPGHNYRGYELLQALLAAGLRYGKWGIFHRHEEITGRGPILFSLASSVEPGTFDLAKMGSFSTPGLTLFMRSSNLENAPQAFEKLLTAAQQLAEELGGTACDEQRLPLSSEKIALWRSTL